MMKTGMRFAHRATLTLSLLLSVFAPRLFAEPTMEEIQKAAKAKQEQKKTQTAYSPSSSSDSSSTQENGIHYTLKDLEILERNGNYREFLEHARDIRPSQRQSPWKEMVHNMATEYIDFVKKRKQFDAQTFQRIYDLSSWPTLREDAYFHVKWQSYGIKAIRHCLREEEVGTKTQCSRRLDQLWESTTPNPDFSLKVARLKEILDPKADLWKFYRHPIKSKVAIFHCQRSDVQKQIFSHVHKRVQKEKLREEKLKKYLLNIMNQECWSKVVDEFKKILHGPKPQQLSAYHALASMEELSPAEEDTYLVRYLLSDPEVGPLFNKAWARLNDLSQAPERRNRVLAKLKSMDPLPGKIFGVSDHEKKAGILDHFAQNFPAYLDYYGKTCLDYLQGKRLFPRGNPTLECRDLFRAQKK